MRLLKSFELSRAHIALFHDVGMAGLAFILGAASRWGWLGLTQIWQDITLGTLVFMAVSAAVYASLRLHRGIWRYASLDDMFGILKATALTILIGVVLLFLISRGADLSRAGILVMAGAMIALLAVPRFFYRIVKDRHAGNILRRSRHGVRIPVILIGVSDLTEIFIRDQVRGGGSYQPVAIIDEKGRRSGQAIHGVGIMGGIDDLIAVAERLRQRGLAPQRLIITKDLPAAQINQLLELADQLALSLSRLPRLTDFQEHDHQQLEIRPVALEDLLNRPQTVLDRAAIAKLITGQRILVTGAGGTIGAELVRQIAKLEPAHITLVDHSEYALYLIDLELSESADIVSRAAILGDIRQRRHLVNIFSSERPDIVFHAAALKHVPMVEANPEEGILSNVIGTRNVAELARDFGASAFVMISTDKAVNPSNVMGATKRLAESWCQALDRAERQRLAKTGSGTRFVTVRFGNVLGSTGSVVPLFQRQLARGGPLTVTHPEVKRYFMTVREAVELVLQASSIGIAANGDAAGKIFVLDMGEPVRILDLARRMIQLAGLKPDRDIQIVFTGLRPGEKLSEELFHHHEALIETTAKGILLANPRSADYEMLTRALDELELAAHARRRGDAMKLLAHLVPEFRDGEADDLRGLSAVAAR